VEIDLADRQDSLALPAGHVRKAAEAACRMEGRDAELSVVLVGDEEMLELNTRFHDRARTTDVLAFPYDEGEPDDGVLRGEIIVNTDQAIRVAAQHPHDPADELLLYVVHGALHLLGYDDHAPDDTRAMRRREQDVLSELGRRVEY
jgi:probable rRNA maturation factor